VKTSTKTALRRQAEARALADISGSRKLSEADARRLAADARDLVAVLVSVLRLFRRWHAQDYAPLVRLLRATARHVEASQAARDTAFTAKSRKHLRVVRGGRA
jgi:hypothetical protein